MSTIWVHIISDTLEDTGSHLQIYCGHFPLLLMYIRAPHMRLHSESSGMIFGKYFLKTVHMTKCLYDSIPSSFDLDKT